MVKALLTVSEENGIKYNTLIFVCPGCAAMSGGSGIHVLPVNTEVKQPSWDWDKNLLQPTLHPSIRTQGRNGDVCHAFLRGGVFQFLNDCTHPLVGQFVTMPDLPDWFKEEREKDGG